MFHVQWLAWTRLSTSLALCGLIQSRLAGHASCSPALARAQGPAVSSTGPLSGSLLVLACFLMHTQARAGTWCARLAGMFCLHNPDMLVHRVTRRVGSGAIRGVVRYFARDCAPISSADPATCERPMRSCHVGLFQSCDPSRCARCIARTSHLEVRLGVCRLGRFHGHFRLFLRSVVFSYKLAILSLGRIP